MIGITKRMEKTGFIIRKNDQNDDRFKWLEITPKGQQVLKSISDEKERNVNKYLSKHSALSNAAFFFSPPFQIRIILEFNL